MCEIGALELVLSKLYKKHDACAIRIASLSDDVLLEQAKEEYQRVDVQIKTITTTIRNNIIGQKISDLHDELQAFYTRQFQSIDIETCLKTELNLIGVPDDWLCKYRLRMPRGLSERRELCQIANTLSLQIVIRNVESEIIDKIGKESSKKINLYADGINLLNHLSR